MEVDLDLNAHTNARAWHGDRKARSAKQAKTVEANERALAVAGKKAQQQLSKVACLPALPGRAAQGFSNSLWRASSWWTRRDCQCRGPCPACQLSVCYPS